MNKPLNILIVIGTLKVGGGAERVASTVGNELIKRGYDVNLLTFYKAPEAYNFDGPEYSLDNTLIHSRLLKFFRTTSRLRQINRYRKKQKTDVIISFLEEANFYSVLSKLVFLSRTPIIASTRNNPQKREWVFRFLIKHLQKYATTTVAVTRGIEDILRQDFGLKNATTIYNPIDKDKIHQLSLESLPAEYSNINPQNTLVHIGRHTKQKGQWHLLRAFQSALKQKPDIKLIMIGDGPDRKKIEKFIKDNNLENKITLTGNQNNVFPFIKNSAGLVMSSLYEGMPNVVLETLALSRPIITPDCPTGPREIMTLDQPASGALPHYPYNTPFGILTSPLDEEENYNNINENPLSPAEQELATAIIKGLNFDINPYKQKQRINDFAVSETITRWENIISGVAK